MKITIYGKNLKLTPAIQSYAEQKIKKIDRYFKNIINPGAVVMHVELADDKSGREGNRFVCTITGFAPKKQFRVNQAAGDLYAAIDLAEAKLEEQARKYKEKFTTKSVNKTEEIFAIDQVEIMRDIVYKTGNPDIAKGMKKIADLPSISRRKRGPELAGMRKKQLKKRK